MDGRLRTLVLCLTALAVLTLMYTQILPLIQERLSPAPIGTGHSRTNTIPAVRATARIQNNLILTVKRASGETETIVKKGDPWTANLAKLILDVLLGGHYGGTKQAFTYTDGTTGTMIDTEGTVAGYGLNPTFAIAIGNGTAPFSVDDYTLSNQIALNDVPSNYIAFSDNGTCYNINVTSPFTVTCAVNITEVGLLIKVDSDTWDDISAKYLLLSRDLLSPAVHLEANDTISITYVLYFPYGSPPFTKQFYGLVLNYFFGLRAYGHTITFTTTDGTQTSIADTAFDANGEAIKEYLYTWIGNGSATWGYSNYTLNNKIATSPSNTPFSLSYNSTHAVFTVLVTYAFASSNTVSEVGFVIHSIDIDHYSGSGHYDKRDVLILYFVLDNPVYVESGGTFKFKCEIVLPLAG